MINENENVETVGLAEPLRTFKKIATNKKNLLFIFLVVVVCIATISFIYFSRSPKKHIKEKTREIEEIVSTIASNDNFIIAHRTNNYFFDLEGNCYLPESYTICDSRKEEFVTEKNIDSVGIVVKKETMNMNLRFNTYDGVWEVRYYGSKGYYVFYEKSRWGKPEEANVELKQEGCFYYPYDAWKTTCRGKELEDAKTVIKEFEEFLKEMGVNATELYLYLNWFVDQMVDD